MSQTQSNEPVMVSLEFTPNPSTLKYVVNRTLLARGAANFPAADTAQKSPLAKRLFTDVPGIAGIMIGRDFVTVTKGQGGDWETLNRMSTEIIKDHITQGLTIVDADMDTGHANTSSNADTSEIENKIREVLDEKIRPAVAMDGGDIIFDHFEDGVVYLQLQGSCNGCPSSTMTLRMGIETQLKQALPDQIKEVVSV